MVISQQRERLRQGFKMTQTLSVNANNDIYLTKEGNISISTGLQAVLQDCKQVARTLLGECVLDTTRGIPYFQAAWIGVPNIQQFIAALRSAFLSVPDVLEVVSLITSQTDNTLTYTAVIRTIYGSGGLSG